MKKIISLAVFLIFLVLSGKAQDKIYRKNGKIVEAKILEVGTQEIKYKIFKDDSGPIYVLETDKLNKIVFENGKVQKFTVDYKDLELYAGQLTKAIKINFLGPLFGFTQISYEKSTGIGKGYEIGLAIIGAGKTETVGYWINNMAQKNKNQFGLAASFGYKFNKLPNFLFGRTRLTHLMQGSYVKPLLYIGNFSENKVAYKATTGTYAVERVNTTFGALQLELGKQWVFGDRFLLDMYGGIGYGVDNGRDNFFYDGEESGSSYNYVNVRAGRSPGFSLTGGLKIGLLLK